MCPAAADGIFYCAPNTNAGLVLTMLLNHLPDT